MGARSHEKHSDDECRTADDTSYRELGVSAVLSSGRLELRNPIQGIGSQRRCIARDSGLTGTLDVSYTTVECRNEFTQMTKSAHSVGVMSGFLGGHRTCALLSG